MAGFVRSRRTYWHPREIFLLTTRLIAIFPHCGLWGLKTPAIYLFFLQAQRRRQGRVSVWLDDSKERAFLCLCTAYLIVLYIIFVSYYINKACKLVQWMMRWLVIIGTWVRFPGPSKTL